MHASDPEVHIVACVARSNGKWLHLAEIRTGASDEKKGRLRHFISIKFIVLRGLRIFVTLGHVVVTLLHLSTAFFAVSFENGVRPVLDRDQCAFAQTVNDYQL